MPSDFEAYRKQTHSHSNLCILPCLRRAAETSIRCENEFPHLTLLGTLDKEKKKGLSQKRTERRCSPFELQCSRLDPCQSDQSNQFSLIKWATRKYSYLTRHVDREAVLANIVYIKELKLGQELSSFLQVGQATAEWIVLHPLTDLEFLHANKIRILVLKIHGIPHRRNYLSYMQCLEFSVTQLVFRNSFY